jgi:hypothetical protein
VAQLDLAMAERIAQALGQHPCAGRTGGCQSAVAVCQGGTDLEPTQVSDEDFAQLTIAKCAK